MTIKLIITLIFLLFGQILHAEILISIDSNPVVIDESFQLTFESDQKVDGEPDFSPLKSSFSILNTARRSNTQMINGKITRSKKWILTMMANQTGMLVVPAIRFGQDMSRASMIKVVANTTSTKGKQSDDVFIDVEVNTRSPYVQAQIIYTVKLFRAVQTNNAHLTEPEISGGQAIINKLGEDKSFETQIKGKRYVVIQRRYVIFPQSSGALKIEPLIFKAQVGLVGYFNFDPFNSASKSIVKRSESISLDVKPIPDSFTGDTWLPASQLTIEDQWSNDLAKLIQGEATTRTLTLKASGLAASNLPEINHNLPLKLKQYPDQPEFEETYNESGFIGVRRDKMAIIPTEAGETIVPAIKVPWWNTESDKMEVAELPERVIHAAISTTAPINNTLEQTSENEIASIVEASNENDINMSESSYSQSLWKWLSLSLFILWILTLSIFWKSKRKLVVTDDYSAVELSIRQYLKQLKQACIKNEPALAKQALLDWARVNWPDKQISSIDAIKVFCEKELQLKIDELNMCLYGKAARLWDGAGFLKSFESQSFDKNQSTEATGKLEPLYR